MMRNYDKIKNFNIEQMANFLEEYRSKNALGFIDTEKWLRETAGTSFYDCCGKPGIYHDKAGDKECRIIEFKTMMEEKYARIILKKEHEKDGYQVFVVPAHLVKETVF